MTFLLFGSRVILEGLWREMTSFWSRLHTRLLMASKFKSWELRKFNENPRTLQQVFPLAVW
ncbi:hypothetical protein X975_17588, partial [Stegodyphus mimosarum]